MKDECKLVTEIAVALDCIRELAFMLHNKEYDHDDFDYFENAAHNHICNIIEIRDNIFKKESN